MTGLTDEGENTRAISDHPSIGKKWVAVVECIGFPIVVSVLFTMSAGLSVPDWEAKKRRKS